MDIRSGPNNPATAPAAGKQALIMPSNHDTPRCWNCTLDLSKVGLLRIGEAARKCGVGPTTVRRWMEEGDVEWLKLPNSFPMIVADTLPGRRRCPGNAGGFRIWICYVCGNSAERARILLDEDQAAALCRVQKRTLAGWVQQGWVRPEQGGYFYLDSLFQEPRRHRDLDVRG